MITREQVQDINVGSVFTEPLDTRNGVPIANAIRHKRTVCEISYRGISVKNKVYVGGYCLWECGLTVSFSMIEGDERFNIL